MSGYSSFDAYVESTASAPQLRPFGQTLTGTAPNIHDFWTGSIPTAGGVPTTAAVPTSSTAGAMPFINGGTGRLTLAAATLASGGSGMVLMCDRLSHQGGLSGTVTTAQTTNLPTAALTRHTSGVGVMMGLSIYTNLGTTATTVTVSYTNSAGTSGRTSPAVSFGDSVRFATYLRMLPLQEGDVGVKSVESVTLAGTTGTAGNFGVTLFKPLVAFNPTTPITSQVFDLLSGGMLGGLPEVVDDAALFFVIRQTLSSNFACHGLVHLEEVA